MQLFSHLLIAKELLAYLPSVDLAEYYWGAVAADVRYFAGLPRKATHVSQQEVREWQTRFPDLQAFVWGYRVHVIADERDAAGFLYDFIPWRRLRRRLPRRWAAFLLEAAYVERGWFEVQIAGTHNLLFERLGVGSEAVSAYAAAVQRYTRQPNLETAETALFDLGIQSPRLKRYLAWARWLQRSPRLQHLLLSWIDEKMITQRVVQDLRAFI